MRLTPTTERLGGAELATTGLAVATSSLLYQRYGHRYLARGVVGDLLGFGLLSGLLWARRRRARHEALVCLAAIAVVGALNPQWPEHHTPLTWWLAVTSGLSGYVALRHRVLEHPA